MGKPTQNALSIGPTVGVPPAGDRANFVISGKISAVGPQQSFYAYGPFNCWIWGSVNTTLTISADGDATAAVGSGAGLGNGGTIISSLVPPGTTFTISSTTVTFKLPPGFTSADILAGADTAALFVATAWAATVNIERSFDGGATWLCAGVGGAGAGASYVGASQGAGPPVIPVSVIIGEPEQGMLYRLNCVAFTSGVINWRISGTSAAASAWAFSSAV